MKLTDNDKFVIKQQFMNLAEKLATNITEALELVCKSTKADADEAQAKAVIDNILQTVVASIEESTNNITIELKKITMEGHHGE